MKKLYTLLLLLPSVIYAQQKDSLTKTKSAKNTIVQFADQQSITFKLKASGKIITKSQFDSLKTIYQANMQYGMSQDQGKMIVEITLPGSDSKSSDVMEPSSNKAITFSSKENTVYKDTLGNAITRDAFKERINSGKYVASYVTEGDKTTFLLSNKSMHDQEAVAQTQAFRNKLIKSKLPDFQLKTVDGRIINTATLKGKVIVMNFWFVGCKPCIEEMPLLNEVVAHYKNKPNILFLALALDEQDKLITFFKKHSFSYQVLASAKDFNKKMDVNSYPTHLIIDADGVIKEVIIGGSSDIDVALIKTIDMIADN